MPTLDHANPHEPVSGGKNVVQGSRASPVATVAGRRRGIPVDIRDASDSLLSPLLSALPTLPGIPSIPSLKGFRPSPTKQTPLPPVLETPRAAWQTADLGDGKGPAPLLLLSTSSHALQIYRYNRNRIPDDPHIQETFPAPEEIFSLPTIPTSSESTSLDGPAPATPSTFPEHVVCARILGQGESMHGDPAVAVVTTTPKSQKRRASYSSLALVIISVHSGKAVKRVHLGSGISASMAVSNRAFVIAVSHPTPTIHILDPATLEKLHPSITSLPASAPGSFPTFALSGRLLAFATSDIPLRPGPDGLGTLITASSIARVGSPSSSLSATQSRSNPSSAQGDLLTSAVEIGGGVARGVWAGIKMGARAANKARSGRLAQSAPAEASGVLADDEGRSQSPDGESELGDSECSAAVEPIGPTARHHGGEWIRIIDIAPRHIRPRRSESPQRSVSRSRSEEGDGQSHDGFQTIAHFRLPASRSLAPIPPDPTSRRPSRGTYAAQPVAFLSFNPAGTVLLAAPEDGRAQHVFEVHPAGPSLSPRTEVAGEVWHMYELRRGSTTATVCDVSWSKDGRWVGVGTSKGTIHVYPISSGGGISTARSHATVRPVNPLQLYPLSTVVSAAARFRPRRPEHPADPISTDGPGLFAFTNVRADPLDKARVLQDIVIFRPGIVQLELGRLFLCPAPRPPPSHLSGHGRASALTEMMRTKAGLGDGCDLEVGKAVIARWSLPLGGGDEAIQVVRAKSRPKTLELGSSLARAEISTHCSNPKILPGTIYLSRQVDFFAARPIDEYSPLSILDQVAKTRRLVFRPEVEARSTSPLSQSFDQPLSTALQSVIESPSSAPIPGLPNGYPSSGGSMWRTIPIRHVAVGLGEGVGRVRREYVRAQHSRARRRASEAAQNSLSFEDETVFPAPMVVDGDGGESSPSSAMLPATNTDSSVEGGDDGWGDGWEAEYARAVEDDGAPEELVLGMMDEEEDEQRQWDIKVQAGGWK